MEETLDEILGLTGKPEAIHGKVVADGGNTIIVHPTLSIKDCDVLKVMDTNELMLVRGRQRGAIRVSRGYSGTKEQQATGSVIMIIGSTFYW